jgi:hypothetical protein
MSKLFALKEWVTIGEAARHLATVFAEEVTPEDVLRLGLDGHLVLSVDLVNHATARKGKVVGFEEVTWGELSAEDVESLPNVPAEAKGKPLPYMTSLHIDDERYLNLEDDVQTIRGVWDLPMIGGERLDVKHRYELLTGGPAVTLENIEGAFVQRGDVMCQLCESYDNNEFSRGSRAALETLKHYIEGKELSADEAERLLVNHAAERKLYLDKRAKRPKRDDYYPAGGLPADCVLVVRTAALRSLQETMSDEQESGKDSANAPSSRERTTYLNIVAALLELTLTPREGRTSEARVIREMIENYGEKPGISERTLAQKFAEAKRSLMGT